MKGESTRRKVRGTFRITSFWLFVENPPARELPSGGGSAAPFFSPFYRIPLDHVINDYNGNKAGAIYLLVGCQGAMDASRGLTRREHHFASEGGEVVDSSRYISQWRLYKLSPSRFC